MRRGRKGTGEQKGRPLLFVVLSAKARRLCAKGKRLRVNPPLIRCHVIQLFVAPLFRAGDTLKSIQPKEFHPGWRGRGDEVKSTGPKPVSWTQESGLGNRIERPGPTTVRTQSHLISEQCPSFRGVSSRWNPPGEGVGIAQLVERRTRDREVAGSIPGSRSGRIFVFKVNFPC